MDELNQRGAVLKVPKFTKQQQQQHQHQQKYLFPQPLNTVHSFETKGESQLSASEVDESRQLAHVRIHVERVIGRLKDFKILQSIIPISQIDLIDDLIAVVFRAVNLNKSVVPK